MRRLLVVALLALLGQSAVAQSSGFDQQYVGSEWELYARALAVRGALGGEPWSMRPFAPEVVDRWQRAIDSVGLWKASPTSSPRSKNSNSGITLFRPSLSASYNSGFPWGFNDGPVWQGRGLNLWGTLGGEAHWGHLWIRLEPTFAYAENRAFPLQPAAGANPYVSSFTPTSIDEPQRFGDKSYALFDPGQSYVRFDFSPVAFGLSTEDLFWGPGVEQALLFDGNAAGFPHVFAGTSHAIATPLGRFSAQVIYGRLEQSEWSPPSVSDSRFGSGLIAVWMPPKEPIEIGFARFYHRAWPQQFSVSDLRVPFGSFFGDNATLGSDNQLLSVFGSVRVPRAGLEVFGEFGKNDRNADVRDVIAEPEQNSAWLLGFLKTFSVDRSGNFWTWRTEAASGRVSAIQEIGRFQSSFYDHVTVTQGHTERGQLLGTPLIDQSGGLDMAVDRWTKQGRMGVTLFERQMPADLGVGMPANQARSQWDVGVSVTRFLRGVDLSAQAGYVWDLNRFAGVDVGNSYLRLTVR